MSIGKTVLNLLKNEISEADFNRYIKQISYCTDNSKSDLARFNAPNLLIANWVKTKYSNKIAHLFELKTGIRPQIEIGLPQKKNKSKASTKPEDIATQNKPVTHSLLNPSYTFNNFVEGSSNNFAYVASENVAKAPGAIYNPLFIYGGVGLGKTHLLQAIGNYNQDLGKSVIYTTVEQFINDFTRHIRNGTMDRFREKYRLCDLLLIDDIQFLSGKTQTQEEFFHTFNELKDANKQIILTADRKPKEIAGIEDRLISRFEWGLLADIQAPELETKIAIIKKKCEINHVLLSNEVVEYIATVIDSNAREIEGILNKLHGFSRMMNKELTLEFTIDVLKDHIKEKRDHITVEDIMKVVSKELNIKPSEIRSKSRTKNIVYARRVAIYLTRNLTQNTMPELAKFYGMKDHTSVSHTMKAIEKLLNEDANFKLKINELTNKITSND